MLSIDLFDSKFEKKLHEGAVDNKQAPNQTEPKGIGDVQDPRQKMAQLQQKAKKGPLANVGAGLKAFLKGEPEPMDEQQPEQNPRAFGVANFQRLVKANMGAYPTVDLEFIRAEENFKLDKAGIDLISDYYDSLENDQAKNYFIYRVLPSGDETRKVLRKLGWSPQVQQSLPGISTQGELPLSERQAQKKKRDQQDLEAGDVKTAREIQKLRAAYPGAKSDIEALARAEIDSTERNRRQLDAIRGANTRQDELLRRLVDLDQEQGREINNLDKENDSLDQQLAQVQATNARLAQTVSQMTGAKKSAKSAQTVATINLIPGAPADASAKDKTVKTEPEKQPAVKAEPSPAIDSMAKTIQSFSQPAPDIRQDFDEPAPSIRSAANDADTSPLKKVSGSDVKEHGGGIGPRQHWQSMMQEGAIKRALDDYKIVTDAEFFNKYKMTKRNFYDEVINARNTKKPYKAPQTCPQCGKAHESCVCESNIQQISMPGTVIPRKSVIQGYTVFWNPTTKIVSVTRGGDSEEAAIEQARLGVTSLKSFRQAAERLIDRIESSVDENQLLDESAKDVASATAVIACLLTGGTLSGCATAPQQTTSQQVLKTGQDLGRTIQTAKKITRAGVEAEVAQELRNLARGVSGRPEELNHSNILKIWRRINQPTAEPQNEAREIRTRHDYEQALDSLDRQLKGETNPAVTQILRKQREELVARGQAQGWSKNKMVREDNASLPAEDAILRRIMVAHIDLLQKYGPQKVMQAAEEVAYNVGDVDEIGTSVNQVKQILGATP